jgi:hypothetical protein
MPPANLKTQFDICHSRDDDSWEQCRKELSNAENHSTPIKNIKVEPNAPHKETSSTSANYEYAGRQLHF